MNFPKRLLAMLFLGFASCSQKDARVHHHQLQPTPPVAPPIAENLKNGIVNGQIPKSYELAYKYTVAVRNFDERSLCTGAIVGPRLIVTAAHCVKTAKGTMVYFGASIKEPVDAIQAVKLVIPKQYKRFVNNINSKAKDIADVAAIVLARDIPKTHRVARFMEPNQKLREGDRLMLVGFGTTGERQKDSGTLRKTNINVLYPNWGHSEFVLDQSVGSGACFGDSGGPAFYYHKAEYRLAGIASRVGNLFFDRCEGFSIYSKASYYRSFIESALN